MTPIHIAAYIGDYKVIKLLLLYFVDANIKDIYGKIPLDYARERGYGKAIDALKNSIYRKIVNLQCFYHLIFIIILLIILFFKIIQL